MNTARWPQAIATITGMSEAHSRHVLRRLREASLIPVGHNPPPFTGTQIARVLIGLCLDHLPTLAAEVTALEAAPSRTVPVYGTPTAGSALAGIVDGLNHARVRAIGAIELNRSWKDITLHSFDDDGLPVVQRYGSGDTQRFGQATATTVLPLQAVQSIARLLSRR